MLLLFIKMKKKKVWINSKTVKRKIKPIHASFFPWKVQIAVKHFRLILTEAIQRVAAKKKNQPYF